MGRASRLRAERRAARPILGAGDSPGGEYLALVVAAYEEAVRRGIVADDATAVLEHLHGGMRLRTHQETWLGIWAAARTAREVAPSAPAAYIAVVHDEWCALVKVATTPCNCRPDVLVAEARGRARRGAA